MTKADQKEFDKRLAECGYRQELSIRLDIACGMTSKAKELAKWREKETA